MNPCLLHWQADSYHWATREAYSAHLLIFIVSLKTVMALFDMSLSLCECITMSILEGVAMHSSRGIFLIQGWNPCLLYLLHWQAGSLPLVPPGMPTVSIYWGWRSSGSRFICHLGPTGLVKKFVWDFSLQNTERTYWPIQCLVLIRLCHVHSMGSKKSQSWLID